MRGEEFKDDFRRALASELVRELTRRSAWRASAAVFADVAVLALAVGIALAYWPNPLALLPAIIVIGSRQHALFVIAHEAAHYLLYERRWLNDLAGRACAAAQGLSMCTYRVIHPLHHNNLYGARDRRAWRHHRFFIASHGGAHEPRACVAALADFSAQRQLSRRASPVRVGAAVQPAAGARGDETPGDAGRGRSRAVRHDATEGLR